MASVLSRVAVRVGLGAVLLIAWPAIVDAQPAPAAPAPPDASKVAVAKRLVARGIAAQDAKDYDKAIDLYKRAFDLVPHPILLFNIAQVHRLAGRLDRAIRFYEGYLSRDPNGKEAATARAFLATLSKAAPAQDVERDTEPDVSVEETDASTRAEPEEGARETSVSRQVDLPQRPGRTLRIAGIATGGVGITCAGVALAFGLRLESIEKEQLSKGPPFDPDRLRAGEAAERNQYIAAALAGAFVVSGAVLYWIGHRKGRAAPTTAWIPLVGVNLAGFSFTGSLP